MAKNLYLPPKYKNIKKLLRNLGNVSEEEWVGAGEKRVLGLFHGMAKRVPAYSDFLKKKKINPDKVATIGDFKNIPTIDKDNYLRVYPLEMLCWDGKFKDNRWIFAMTSGSTGEPFYFPREESQDFQYASTAELYLNANFELSKKTTLYVNCFALGVWIGGLFTHEALRILAEKGKYRLSIISPGLNKLEIIRVIKKMGDRFDQVILGGYPPFIKDVIDDGIQSGLDWKKYNLKFVFSAEAFSEDFRDYIAEKSGIKNIYRDTLNHYGTVDQGTLAHETSLAVLIRRLAVTNEKVFRVVFGGDVSKLPTLAQYDPELFFFEENNGGLICSSYSGLPLVRYDLKDSGGIFTFDSVMDGFKNLGIDLYSESENVGVGDIVWRLPFVYVYERKDLAVSMGGAIIYPETIRKALSDGQISKIITGKFTMVVERDINQNQNLEINIELKNVIKEVSSEEREFIEDSILRQLLKENSEFRSVFYDQRQGKSLPVIKFWPYEHLEYFKVGGKQKWVKNK